MRILFLSHYFPPEVNAPAVRTYEHCREWVRAGHEVHVITCVPNHPRGEVYTGYERSLRTQHERAEGIQVHRVWTYVAPNRGFFRRTLGYMSYMLSAPVAALGLPRPDVLVATSPQFFCACAGSLTSKLLACPWIFELRDLWPASLGAVGALKARAVMRFFERIELYLYRDADHVVALTHPFRENLISRGVPGSKIKVVMNGVDLGEWGDADRKGARRALGLDSSFVVSYVGTHGLAHNLEVLLEAAHILRKEHDIRFLTVGDGAERDKLRALKNTMALGNVTMVGQVPRDEARLYVQASDVSLVLLRRADLFETVVPSKIFEAMAAGTPIILGVGGEAKRIVEGADAGLCIEPENAQELAEAVRRLKQDGDLRSRLGRNGRSAVEKRFGRDVLARRMLEIVQGVVAGNSAQEVGTRGHTARA